MIYFLLQVLETIKTHHVFAFELFVIYVFTVWLLKYIPSRFYHPIESGNKLFNASVIIPVLNEDSKVFEKCLQSLKYQASEIIVIIDINETNPDIARISRGYADKTIESKKTGKRHNIMIGVHEAQFDIIVSMDSDTILAPNAIRNILLPFYDDKVGGVTTRQHIIEPKRNIINIICEWMENVRFNISMPAQSLFGCIGCLPGRAIAFRKNILLKHEHHFVNQWFLGKLCDSGDDRVITGYCLHDGYKTVYQSNAICYTDCPRNWKGFIKQQLRWARSSQRETLLNLKWLWKKPYTFFVFVTDIITPILFVSVIVYSIYNIVTGKHYFNIPLWQSIIMGLVGMNISLGIRQYPHLKDNRSDIIYLPIYVLFMTFILTPIRIVGLLTCYKTNWMTR